VLPMQIFISVYFDIFCSVVAVSRKKYKGMDWTCVGAWRVVGIDRALSENTGGRPRTECARRTTERQMLGAKAIHKPNNNCNGKEFKIMYKT